MTKGEAAAIEAVKLAYQDGLKPNEPTPRAGRRKKTNG